MNGGAYVSFARRPGRRYHDELPANDPCIHRIQNALCRLSDRLFSHRAGRLPRTRRRLRCLHAGAGLLLEHDPEKHALGLDPMGGNRFSLATNAERVCAEIMLKQRASVVTLTLVSPVRPFRGFGWPT